MSYNSGSNRARNFKSGSRFALVRFLNYSRDYSLNCTLLDPITITYNQSWVSALVRDVKFILCWATFTLRGRNLKTALYFHLQAFRPHYNPSRKGRFTKTLFKPGNLKTPALRLGEKHFENLRSSLKKMSSSYHDLPEIYSNTNTTELPAIVPFSNFSGVVWTENIWYVLGVKPPFSHSYGIV